MDALFPPLATPRTTHYLSPGDIVKKPRKWKQDAGHAPRVKREAPDNRRRNNWRQPIADQDETDFRHMHWQRRRDQVRHAMATAGTCTHAMDRFDNCGAECVVEWSDEAQRYRLRASYCKCRHCSPCMKQKGNLIAMNLQAKIEAGPKEENDRFRFITLTLRHTTRPLAEQIADLQRHFRILRGSKLWKSSQRGGAAMIEVKLNARNEWHPHLHIISEGDFIRQHTLANEWMRITNGSFKVDVRKIDSKKDVAFYVAKYVTKGVNDEVWSVLNRAQEWITATRHLRTCATYGTWRGFKLTARNPVDEVKDWKAIGLLSRIADDARRGMLYALELLRHLGEAHQYDPGHVRNTSRTAPS